MNSKSMTGLKHRSGQVCGFKPCAQRVNQVMSGVMDTAIIYLI